MSRITHSVITIALLLSTWAVHSDTASKAEAYIISPRNGDVVTNPVRVVFGLRGMGVAPAGANIDKTGHHHLLINTDLPALDKPIPKDEQHRHFGGGQTEAEITLPTGKHTLQLLLGDYAHKPHEPPVKSERITIEVK